MMEEVEERGIMGLYFFVYFECGTFIALVEFFFNIMDQKFVMIKEVKGDAWGMS